MIPVLALSIAGGPSNATVRDRLLELTITDSPGIKADALQMRFDNRKPRITIPAKDVEIAVGLGYEAALPIGTFSVDVVGATGSPANLTIRAKAVSMTAGMKEPKTRSWTDTTLGGVLSQIAGEHGLRPAIAGEYAGQFYETISQNAESDFNLITRFAKIHGAVGKPKDGELLFHGRGKPSTASSAGGVIALAESDFSKWSWESEDRPAFTRVKAWYRDFKEGKRMQVSVGGGRSSIELRETYVNKGTALSAAAARLNNSVRLVGKLNGTLSRGNGRLRAERRISVSGLMPEIDGLWSLTRVVHRYSKDAFLTSFEAEIAL